MTATVGPGARQLRTAIVGLGDISPMHIDAILANPAATLTAVCDVDADLATAAATRLGCAAHADLERMLDEETLDVVHICTPHHLHAGMAIACLARGVNVLLEKPLATSVVDGEAVAVAARASDAMIGVCFQNRYNTTAMALRRLIDDDSLGALLGGRAFVTWHRDEAYYRRRPWRGTWAGGGGGVLINQAIHTLDLLQWYLGEVEDVRGQAHRLWLPAVIEVEDTAAIQLRHRSGARSVFYATNGYATDAPVLLELFTERGSVRLDTDLTVSYRDGRQEVIRESRPGSGEKAYWGLSHGVLIDDFYRHVLAGHAFWIDAHEALKTLHIITAVYDQSNSLR